MEDSELTLQERINAVEENQEKLVESVTNLAVTLEHVAESMERFVKRINVPEVFFDDRAKIILGFPTKKAIDLSHYHRAQTASVELATWQLLTRDPPTAMRAQARRLWNRQSDWINSKMHHGDLKHLPITSLVIEKLQCTQVDVSNVDIDIANDGRVWFSMTCSPRHMGLLLENGLAWDVITILLISNCVTAS